MGGPACWPKQSMSPSIIDLCVSMHLNLTSPLHPSTHHCTVHPVSLTFLLLLLLLPPIPSILSLSPHFRAFYDELGLGQAMESMKKGLGGGP
jgi:hypothetical protein